MAINRRMFLKSGGIAIASFGVMGTAPTFMQRAVMGQTKSGKRKTLIAIFQRGAVDGLNMVVPYAEKNYYAMRPTIAIPRPASRAAGAIINPNNTDAAIDLDGFFGLHPSLANLQPLFANKRMAIVHAAGSPDATRSHFDAQDYMESGTPGVKSTPDGWLNRVMQTDKEGHTLFRAVAMSNTMPRSLQGRAEALAISNLRDFTIRAGTQSASVQGGFESLYEQNTDALSGAGKETFEAVNYLKRVNPSQYQPQNGAQYPRGRFGESLLQIAQLVKSDVGLEIAFAETGGWDTHVNQGGARGQLANRLTEFGQGIAALVKDLGTRMDDVVILTMSEFGRTARENGTRGTDHGHANAMFVIGNSVRGGKVYGDWLGLSEDKLYEGRDLALTTDFRDVFGEVAARHLNTGSLNNVFPNYEINHRKFRGVLG